ncbi:ATP-binding protein [Chryseobacterium sp. 09-1422]|uniref:ATP-binding protein n=1 Tax=Chryseobacterium kimseyorum TaxID=2984028 RepID=A0ABT3HXE2_9FLAO|nr:ATP-binding protein [Chryseobacterium kimseyorum]MCW3168480.1 ATP-binding protein [Chryseobacterium kimseyorum]
MKSIIFIGGIHGSGKGRICEEITGKSNLVHLTASQVLKWNEISNKNEKIVKNISDTQNRLIDNLKNIVSDKNKYLLDGHFCLLNKDRIPEKIPIKTFLDIAPVKLILVTANPELIRERLANRDNMNYSIELIEKFQNLEIEFSKEISHVLGSPLHLINSEEFDIDNTLNFLR